MKIPVRTLSAQDADILARTIVSGVVHNGCVERYDLSWRSDALRTWEIEQRSLGRKPEVNIRIDELDLSVVYVDLPDRSRPTIQAFSRHPKYTHGLSLYEHRKLKKKMRELRLQDRLAMMDDKEAFDLRVAYYAYLGRGDDPVAYRRLIDLKDRIAALRAQPEDPPASLAVDVPPPGKPRKRKTTGDRPAVEPKSKPPPAPMVDDETTASHTPPENDVAPAGEMEHLYIKRIPYDTGK